jgi:RecA-family ATPase
MQYKIFDENNKLKRSHYIFNRLTVNGKLGYIALIPELKTKDEYGFKNCSCPFRKDKRPSLSITVDRSTNTWLHFDHGDSTITGNIFDFAARKFGLDSKVDSLALLNKMYEYFRIDEIDKTELQGFFDHGIGTTEVKSFNVKLPVLNSLIPVSYSTEDPEDEKPYINDVRLDIVEEKNLDANQKTFLEQTGISYETMQEYGAYFIDSYTECYGKDGYGSGKKFSRNNNHIWICYSFGKSCKIYRPSPKKFWYVNKSPSRKYLFGTPRIHGLLNGDTVILTAGEKDALCCLSRGIYAMCLGSESTIIDRHDAKYWLYDCNYRVITIYDLDETGIKQAQKIKEETGIRYALLPDWLKEKGGKDITDFFMMGGTKEELENLIEGVYNKKDNVIESTVRLLPVRTAAQRIKDAQSQPDIYPHADVLFQTNELTIFFGDTGKGKSIFAVALANAISKGITFLELENKCEQLRVLYYDFELSDKQFEKRYTSENGEPYVFNDNFFIDNIDLSGIDLTDKKIPFDEHLIKKIRHDVKELSAKVLIIDNITFLSTYSAEDGQVAMRLMKSLKELKAETGISIMVLAHTPKKFGLGGISLPDLAGSKHLSNFCDSVTALGVSKKDSNLRYIIQVKPSRTGEVKYDAQNVILCEIQKFDSFLTFILKGYDEEQNHLSSSSKEAEDEMINKAKELHKEGKTYREIADVLKVSKSTVGRWLKPE